MYGAPTKIYGKLGTNVTHVTSIKFAILATGGSSAPVFR
jgi:hypothetical protein